MKDLRIVFMGTPGFAVQTLRLLVENNYTIVGVITAPDKPAGRGRKLRQSEVKKYALSKGLSVLQPTNLKSPEFLEKLKILQANLQIVVAFRMLPKVVWNMPELGTFNLHASLLPKYRGAAPINWAIINGETETGVTTFFLDEKIDTGEIILQKKVAIKRDDTAGDLHDRLMIAGAQLVINTVELIERGNMVTKPQMNTKVSPAPKLNRENCKIDWSNSAEHIYNKVRGLSPFPLSWSYLMNNGTDIEVQFYRTEILNEEHQLKPGTIVPGKKELKVAVAGKFIKIIELKMSGKRKMDVISFLNGFRFASDAMLH